MQAPKHFVRFSELDKHDVLQVLSTQYGISERMSPKEFKDLYLDEMQDSKLRFKEWYDTMSLDPEEAWPDMEWLLVFRDDYICQVVP